MPRSRTKRCQERLFGGGVLQQVVVVVVVMVVVVGLGIFLCCGLKMMMEPQHAGNSETTRTTRTGRSRRGGALLTTVSAAAISIRTTQGAQAAEQEPEPRQHQDPKRYSSNENSKHHTGRRTQQSHWQSRRGDKKSRDKGVGRDRTLILQDSVRRFLDNSNDIDDETPIPVLIGYTPSRKATEFLLHLDNKTRDSHRMHTSQKNNNSNSTIRSLQVLRNLGIHLSTNPALQRVYAAKGRLTKAQVHQLIDQDQDHLYPDHNNNHNIAYIEVDALVKPLLEVTPYGVDMVQGMSDTAPPPPQTHSVTSSGERMGSPCAHPDSFKIAIVDSGLDVSHPDIPCFMMDNASLTNCIGATFGSGLIGSWNTPTDLHGTFVTGIVGAVRNNNVGITGVLNHVHVCWITARVFGGEMEALLSDVLEAVGWAAYTQGAHVINLSLGGEDYSTTAEMLYADLREQHNTIVVAASGNDGTSAFFYPASFSSTTSVGAIDRNYERGSFSQYNAQVDVAAPGVDILSTSPIGLGGLTDLVLSHDNSDHSNTTTTKYPVLIMTGSPPPGINITGTLVDCDDGSASECPGSGGHICFIRRGTTEFDTMAVLCAASGGAAGLVYNNQDGYFNGALTNNPSIPLFALDQETALYLMENHVLDTPVTLVTSSGYTIASGTSFAAPFAAGAVAAIWQPCLAHCSNDDVLYCLYATARDLGDSGRDDEFGHGLVQIEDAYACLVRINGCCAETTSNVPSSPVVATVPTAPAPAPSSSSNYGEEEECSVSEYQWCFVNAFESFADRNACADCINAALERASVTAITCEEHASMICAAIDGSKSDSNNSGGNNNDTGCSCSTCGDVIEAYIACEFVASDHVCPVLNCTHHNNNNNSGGGEGGDPVDLSSCVSEQDAMEICLTALATQDEQTTLTPLEGCADCFMEILPWSISHFLSSNNHCSDLNQQIICPERKACVSSCGSTCLSQVNAFLQCAMETNTESCNLNCGNNINSNTTNEVSSSAFSSQSWFAAILIGSIVSSLLLQLL